MIQEEKEILLLKDSQWSVIDGEPCLVTSFNPLVGFVKDGKVISVDNRTPYASVSIECKKLPQKITGYITHKLDFTNLWAVFKERGIKQDEEVIIFWSKKNYKSKLLNFFPAFWPKLWIMICHKGTYDGIKNSNLEPWFIKEEFSIADWKPEVMK